MRLRLLPRDRIYVAAQMVVAQHHGVVLDAVGGGQTIVVRHAAGRDVRALRLHLVGVQPLGVRVVHESPLAADVVVVLDRIAALHVGRVGIGRLLKIARARCPRLGCRELPLRLCLAIRVVVVLHPVPRVLAFGPLVLLIQ